VTSRRQRERQARADRRRGGPAVDGQRRVSAFGMVRSIPRGHDRVMFMRLDGSLAAAWCRTPGALYRPGLIARLAAGLVTEFGPTGGCL